MRVMLIGAWAAVSVRDVQDGYEKALRAAGHEVSLYKLCERLDDAGDELMRRWKRSAKAMGYPRPNPEDVTYFASKDLIERYLWHQRPEWVIAIGGKCLHPQVVVWLRQIGAKVAVLLTESPYEDEDQGQFIRFVDFAWTNERASVPYLRQFNPHVSYLPHAYDPERHVPDADPEDADVPAHDVVFVGTGFPERQEILQAVNWDGIDLGLYGAWPFLGSRAHLRRYVRGGFVDNRKAAGLYRRAKVGLNLFRSSRMMDLKSERVTTAESLNPRSLELAACGVFQVCDARPEVAEVFRGAVETFQTPRELESIIRLSLPAERYRRACAEKARQAIAGQTFAARVEQMMSDLSRYQEEVCRPQLAHSMSS